MKKILIIGLMFFLAVALLTPAYSSDHGKKHHFNGHFGDLDTDGNDQLSWEEFKQNFPHADKATFKKIDTDNNGSIDHDEWHDFKATMGYKHKE